MKNLGKLTTEESVIWNYKKNSMPASKIRIGSLFTGIGAFEQALNILKIKNKIIFACDNDPFAKKSYFANYNISEKNWYNDVHHIKGSKYKNKIDLLVGGAPCQSFSMVGKRKEIIRKEQERIKRNQEAKARERRYIFWCNPNEPINKNKLGSSRIIRNKKYDYYY